MNVRVPPLPMLTASFFSDGTDSGIAFASIAPDADRKNWTFTDPFAGLPPPFVSVSVTVPLSPPMNTAGNTTCGIAANTSGVLAGVIRTVCVRAAELALAYAPSPLYAATICCLPAASAAVESFAMPFTSGAEPSDVAPAKNVTVPVGTAAAPTGRATVAVSWTGTPTTAGFAPVRTVTVGAIGCGVLLIRTAAATTPSGWTPAWRRWRR